MQIKSNWFPADNHHDYITKKQIGGSQRSNPSAHHIKHSNCTLSISQNAKVSVINMQKNQNLINFILHINFLIKKRNDVLSNEPKWV